MKRSAALLAVAVALPAWADVSGSAPGLDDYYPFREGRVWVYRTAGGRGEARATADGLELPNYFDATRRAERLVREKGRIAINAIAGNEIRPGVTLLAEPFRRGASWSSKGQWAGSYELTLTGKVLGFETASVPAGRFRCAKIELLYSFRSGGSVYDYFRTLWLAPGVGIVRHDYRHVNGANGTMELESYRR